MQNDRFMLYGSRAAFGGLLGLLLWLLDPHSMGVLVVVAGQAHFASTYFYKFRAGKLPWLRAGILLAAAVVVFAAYNFRPNLPLLILFVSTWFMVHCAQDEVFLLGEEASPQRGAEILPAILMFAAFTLVILRMPGNPVLVGVALSVQAWCVFRYVTGQWTFGLFSGYCHAISLLLLVASVFRPRWHHDHYFGTVIVFHYLNWYFSEGRKRLGDRPQFLRYVWQMLLILALVIVTFLAVTILFPFGIVFGILFSSSGFLLCTLFHLVVSMRRQDLRLWGAR